MNKWEVEDAMRSAKVMTEDMRKLMKDNPPNDETLMGWIMFMILVDGELGKIKAVITHFAETKKNGNKG